MGKAFLALGLLLAYSPVIAQTEAALIPGLEGCWQAGSFRESWVRQADGSLLGAGYLVREGSEWQPTETLRIDRRDGRMVYHATPVGAQTTDFPHLPAVGPGFAFEDPTHDFPRRLHYTFDGPDQLNVLLTGEEAGKPREQRFVFTRAIPCGAIGEVGMAWIPIGGLANISTGSELETSGRLVKYRNGGFDLRFTDSKAGYEFVTFRFIDVTKVSGQP